MIGPPNRSSENALGVIVVGRDGEGVVVAPGIGVQLVVLKQAVGGAVEAVGSGLQNGDDGAAVGVSVGGRCVGRNHADFVDSIRRRVVSDEVVLRLVQVRAFERVVVGLGAIAIDRSGAIVIGLALDRVVAGHSLGIGVDGSRLIKRQG